MTRSLILKYKIVEHVKLVLPKFIVSMRCFLQSSVVVVDDAAHVETSYKCKQAAKLDLPVVTTQYLEDCVAKGAVLETRRYMCSATAADRNFQKGKIIGRFLLVLNCISLGKFTICKLD